jgi:RimJ/RimL family protein N-acetyltransferase
VSRLLSIGFSALGLGAVSAWVVDGNTPSLRILERNSFKFIGRQRMCHVLGGAPRDRLLFDLIASEHKERA